MMKARAVIDEILRREPKGQTLVIFAVMLVGLLGVSALSIDLGYSFYAKRVLQNAADAAGMAGASGLSIDQNTASARAQQNFASNQAFNAVLTNAILSLTYPDGQSIQATVWRTAAFGNPLNLFVAPILGINSVDIEASGQVRAGPVGSVDPGQGWGVAPVAIMCNLSTNCGDVFTVGDTFTLRRVCGHFPNACSGDDIEDGDIFLQGIDIDPASPGIGTAEFRERTYCGCCAAGTCGWPPVNTGDVVPSLPGERNGWRFGMQDRLAEGRNEMIFPVITDFPADHSNNFADVTILDFMAVRVINFTPKHGNSPESITFEVIPTSMESLSFNDTGTDLDIGSVVTYKITD